MSIGQKIRQLREEKNMTQEDVAALLFVTRNAVSKWETNKGTPSIDNLQSIATLFDTTIDNLLGGATPFLSIQKHSYFVLVVSILSFIVYIIQSIAFSYSMTLFIVIQICIYAFSTILIASINRNQMKHKKGLIDLLKPVAISILIQVLLGIVIEL